jgi:hypothetical protein
MSPWRYHTGRAVAFSLSMPDAAFRSRAGEAVLDMMGSQGSEWRIGAVCQSAEYRLSRCVSRCGLIDSAVTARVRCARSKIRA